ncbi:flagellar hook protein FlgE [Phyllobacterium calauticae]|uniref:hypothetical protein n=1 Tax=Phyllobacterium calauticae TaxID=2817027 RepID=UPI001CC13021|nr:hypothetical protein [Phyllobacterium calauticae]
MPRTGGIYNAPAGTKGIPNTTIQSAPYNALIDDLVQDANAARPITAGGTGATNATDARLNIGALASADLLAAPTKAVPVDNDGMVITDSEDSGKIKRVLWSVIKDKLKAFFDPIYQRALDAVGAIELNNALAANADTLIDFHSSFPAVDFDFRIIRRSGVNGAAELYNNGTGGMAFRSAGGGFSFDKDITTSGSFQANGGSLNVQAATSGGNAHTWYRKKDGNWGVITYMDGASGAYTVSMANGVSFNFNTDGTFNAGGKVYAGAGAYLNTDGNPYGSRWNTWGSYYAFDAINARIEQRASDYANAVVANRPTGDRCWAVGFWDGDGAQPYFNGAPGVTRFPCDKSTVDSMAVFALLQYTGPASSLGPNQLINSAELAYANVGSGDAAYRPQGTWMLFGRINRAVGTPQGLISIWQRKY